MQQTLQLTSIWDKTFAKSNKVNHALLFFR